MSTTTPLEGLVKPAGNDNVQRAVFNTNYDLQDQFMRRPFYPTAVINVSSQLVFTVEAGRGAIGSTLVTKTGSTTVTVTTPTPGATYYLYVKSDGTFVTNTTGVTPTGCVPICSTPVANPVVASVTQVITDLRAEMTFPAPAAIGTTELTDAAVTVVKLATGAKPPTVARLMALAT